MKSPFNSIAVVGLGVIGSSFAVALRRAYPDVRLVGVDVAADALAAAEERGWIDEGIRPEKAADAFSSCDLVVIATPVPVAP